jgi:Zn-dependent alcohol dehydrogenase
MKSRGGVIRRLGGPWTVEEIDVVGPTEGEVLVEWKAAGLCHSGRTLANWGQSSSGHR